MTADGLLKHFARIADASDAVDRLRRFVLDLAIRGKLVAQDPNDEPATELLKRIRAKKSLLAGTGKIRTKTSETFSVSDPEFDLPAGWARSNVGEICSKTGSGSTPRGGKDAYRQNGIVFLRSQNVYDDGLRLNDVAYIDTATHVRMSGTVVKPGDLLLNITGGSIGRCCRVPDGFGEANVSQHVAIIRVAVDGVQDFLHRVIQSPHFQAFVFNEQTGAGRGGLPKNRMDRIPVALPHLAEQHRIVAKVDELMALCDELEAAQAKRESRRDRLVAATLHGLNNGDATPEDQRHAARFYFNHLPRLTTRPEHIRQLRQTILDLAIRGKLVPQDSNDEPAFELLARVDRDRNYEGGAVRSGHQKLLPLPNVDGVPFPPFPLPESWQWVPLQRILNGDSRNGFSKKPDGASTGIPILRISAATVRSDAIVSEEEHKLISGVDENMRSKFSLQQGDLLACRFNGNRAFVGRLALFKDYLGIDPIYPDKLIRIRLFKKLTLPQLVRYFMNSEPVRRLVETYCATTVGNWGISATNLKRVPVPIPPLAEQHRVVAKVDELMALCDDLEASLTDAADTRHALLEATLHEALAST